MSFPPLFTLLARRAAAALLAGVLNSLTRTAAGTFAPPRFAFAGGQASPWRWVHAESRPAPVLADRTPPQDLEEEAFARLWRSEVTEALASINRLSQLTRCALTARLPRSVRLALVERGLDPVTATPLLRAGALREVLLAAIECLRPLLDTVAPAAQEYRVLHGAFVLELPHQWLMTELAVSARSFYRIRTRALDALTQELRSREAALPTRGRE